MKELNLKIKKHRVVKYFEDRPGKNITVKQLVKFCEKEGIKTWPATLLSSVKQFMVKYRGNTIVRVKAGVYKLGNGTTENIQEAERNGRRSLNASRQRKGIGGTIQIPKFETPESQFLALTYQAQIDASHAAIGFHQGRINETTEKLNDLIADESKALTA